MKLDTAFEQSEAAVQTSGDALIAQAMQPFAPMAAQFRELDDAIGHLEEIGGAKVASSTRKLRRRLWRETPSVTMIGQVKAGKTTLVNAMIGRAGLLPADINPWTSVVTSTHVTPEAPTDSAQAVFQFFDREQWDRLVYKGGRIGELAGRAGATDEASKIAVQLAAMREKSMARLGGKFELLMGQQHRYGYVDAELVERYVCLGDDFENDHDTSKSRGRFADITKSADLLIHQPSAPIGLCIRDTPGVNDTFLMREQVTIGAIRESRTCVVVLSAHQAMSTVDVALLRLIANIPSRNLVIFINRIDELSDPATHVGEIEASIRQTLRDHRGPQDATILFGSAYWANHALEGSLGKMSPHSAETLRSWAEAGAPGQAGPEGMDAAAVWRLSGVPALFAALADRVAESFGAEILDAVSRTAWNLACSLETENRTPQTRREDGKIVSIGRVAVPAELDRLQETIWEQLDADFSRLIAEFHQRVDRSNASFVDRAVTSLIRHLDRSSDSLSWKYDPTGLRMLLRTAFTVYRKRAYAIAEDAFFEAAAGITDIYVRSFDLDSRSFALEPPALPSISMPVLLGETIALDLESNWWSRWWQRRRGFQAYRDDFAELVARETATLVDGLKEAYGAPDHLRVRNVLTEFFDDQRKALLDMWIRKDLSIEDVQLRLLREDAVARGQALAAIKRTLAKNLDRKEGERRNHA